MRRRVFLIAMSFVVAVLLGLPALAGQVANAQGTGTVSILCSQYLRSEPSDTSPRIGLMNPGDRHVALGRDGSWVYLQVNEELQGWAYDGACLRVDADLEALSASEPTGSPVVSEQVAGGPVTASVVCDQNLRSRPSLNGARIEILKPTGGELTVLARSSDSQWVYVQRASGQQGWTFRTRCLAVQGDVLSVPVQDAEASVGPPNAVISCAQNLRSLPALESSVVRVLQPEDGPLPVAGTTSEGVWIYLELPDGTVGWSVNGACISVVGRVWDAPRYAEGILPEGLNLPPDTTPFASIVCSQYLRAAPSLNADRLLIMNPGDDLYRITGRTANGNWLQLENAQQQGWAAWGRCLQLQGDVLSAPVTN